MSIKIYKKTKNRINCYNIKSNFVNNKIRKMKLHFSKGGYKMSKGSKLMSENLKEEIAKELGVYEKVKNDGGWQNVSSKDCGKMIAKAIEIANRKV